MQKGYLGTNAMQRRWAQFSLNQEVTVAPYDPSSAGGDIYLAQIKVEVGYFRKSDQSAADFDTENMAKVFSLVSSLTGYGATIFYKHLL